MKHKRVFYSELSYILGIVILALGTAMMEKADLGISMVVAPAYLLHLKIAQYLPFFSFGMAEYCTQALILVALSLVMGRFKPIYLFSFVTTLIYGLVLDLFVAVLAPVSLPGMAGRAVVYIAGFVVGGGGVSLLFHTYFMPAAYELFVKELTDKLGKELSRVKTVYDCLSCLVAIGLSFAFFGLGHFQGVKLGTFFCALLNGTVIGAWGRLLESRFDFADAFALREKFENG